MTSNTLSGERRWSARRSGMTVLGKVAVPKPINLPSQRLENHGLDPNVEIVPKGTLSWGSKSSLSSNAWGSSALSPSADGSGGSPSHLSACPSSGGSGTRPSTAGSDRAHETGNAWGVSNSRPSSASGEMTSNQTSFTSLRPRSAETRPGSSQLSRFAEPVSESPGAWSAAGTAEKLGITPSKNDGFSLTSGDFPTLGSEKDTLEKNTEPQDHCSHGRPGSSSGEVAIVKESIGTSVVGDVAVSANVRGGTGNSGRRDNPPAPEDGVRPSVEKWHADHQGPHPFSNAGIHPQHYDAWHGPPINNHPGGVWYRGAPGGPPYGSPIPPGPGAFPLEPFPYYRPQIPGTALANPPPVPPPGAGPRALHPKNGDMYRPPIPDAYIRPGMPIRPGFYPPPVAYEGYYGPPMGYCNSSDRDMQFMGMAAGPAAYNRFPGPNAPDVGGSHARSSGYGHSGKALASEHGESGHLHDTRGPYKVLLKQHDGWDGKDEQKWEDKKVLTSVEKDDQQKASTWDNDVKVDHRDEEMNLRCMVGEEPPSHSIGIGQHRGGGSISMKVKPPESAENARTYDSISAKEMEAESLAASKDSSLIQKIEGLNAKARSSNGRYEATYISSSGAQKNKSHIVNAKPNHSLNEGATGSSAIYPDRMHGPAMTNSASDEVSISVGDGSLDSTVASAAVIPRRSTRGMHGITNHHDRGRYNSQEIDRWQKKPSVIDSSCAKPAMDLENSNFDVQDHASGAAERSGYPQSGDEGEPVQTIYDTSDSQAQRAMMKELAKQRMKQRQEEEEERERDQKAKALAKLEELNRRTQAVESSTQKLGADPGSGIQSKQGESLSLEEGNVPLSKYETSSSAVVSNPNVVSHVCESISQAEKSTILSNELLPAPTKNANRETAEEHAQSLSLQEGTNNTDPLCHNNPPRVTDGSAPQLKRVNYRQKHNVPLEKSSTEKPVSASTTEAPKGQTDTTINVALSTKVVANEIASNADFNCAQNIMSESSMQQRRKNGRSSKNKHKVEEASSMGALPSVTSKETDIRNNSFEDNKAKFSDSDWVSHSVRSLSESKEANQSLERQSSSPNEEFLGRVNNQGKTQTQHSRKAARNPQSHWAPVRSYNRSEATEQVSQKKDAEAGGSSAKSDPQLQNNPRNKRAEIERYVPKPVAKEMAQLGSGQQHVAPSYNQTTVNDETVRRIDSGSHGAATATELRSGDARQNQQGKGHGSWLQRASAESSVQSMQDRQPSNRNKSTHKLTVHQEHQNGDELNFNDGWNIPEPPEAALPPSISVVRDQGMAARGKRHMMKGQHRGIGNNRESDHRKGEAENHNAQFPVTDASQTDFPATSKENRGGDRPLCQWQPKSSISNHQANRLDGGQNVGAEIGRGNRKDSNSRGRVPLPPQPHKQTNESLAQLSPKDLSVVEKGHVEETLEMGHLDMKRESRVGSVKGRPYSPNQGAGIPEEPHPSNVETRHEQRMPGPRRNGNQNNRFGRGQEFHGDWNSSGQEHNPPANRDRQRHNSHYEYQPVGPQNNNRANNAEEPKDGSHNTGGRFREKSRSHSRRGGGNFLGRQSGNVRVDGGFD
ncbi:hypothetical protein SLA2020_509670 [Shorea laevis]